MSPTNTAVFLSIKKRSPCTLSLISCQWIIPMLVALNLCFSWLLYNFQLGLLVTKSMKEGIIFYFSFFVWKFNARLVTWL